MGQEYEEIIKGKNAAPKATRWGETRFSFCRCLLSTNREPPIVDMDSPSFLSGFFFSSGGRINFFARLVIVFVFDKRVQISAPP